MGKEQMTVWLVSGVSSQDLSITFFRMKLHTTNSIVANSYYEGELSSRYHGMLTLGIL